MGVREKDVQVNSAVAPSSTQVRSGDTTTESSLASLMTRERVIEVGRILLVAIVTLFFWLAVAPFPVLLAAIAIGLYPLLKTGLGDLVGEHKVGTETFVTIATLVALAGGEDVAAAVLMDIILIAEFIAELNTDRARASIKALIGSVPQSALVKGNGAERTVPVAELKPGDVVLVRSGEKVPVDGTVVGGQGAVDESAISGESLPLEKDVGSSVLAGTLLASGALDVWTDKVGQDTLFARIVALVEHAEEQQAPVQKLADRVSGLLIPVVFVFLIAVYFWTRDVRKIVTLLIFTSPAELGLATPLVMIAAIARAAKHGILVKGGLYLESLARADVVVFDKTGTLTVGQPRVIGIYPAAGYSVESLLGLAAAADRRSGHPLAKAILERANQVGIEVAEPTAFEVIRGRGVRSTVGGKVLIVGNEAFLKEEGATALLENSRRPGTAIHVAVDGKLAGTLVLADEIRPGAKETIAKLKSTGVKRVLMLTGDNEPTARKVASDLGIDECEADLLPDQKVASIARLQKEGHVVAMVGDGVNDAPALALAQVGIAMGARGTQAALEAADIVLMTDDLSKIIFARTLARRAYRTVQENIFVGVGVVHVLGIIAALEGWIGPIQAAMLHLGPDILVFVNSVKLLRVSLD